MRNLFLKNKALQITVILFLFFTFWWLMTNPFNPYMTIRAKEVWSLFYWIFPVFGGLLGVFTSLRVGFLKSVFGQSLLAFSLGLLMQSLGQIIDAFFSIFGDLIVFYPTIAEIGYTGSIFAYIYGSYLLARYIGFDVTNHNLRKSILVLCIPIIMFTFSYFSYLKDLSVLEINQLKIIFDFGYPVLQSIYVTLAIFVLLNSNKIQGGAFRNPTILLVVALVFQYFADAYFVYEFNQGIWYYADFNDYSYLVAYFMLTIAIISLDEVIKNIHLDQGVTQESSQALTSEELKQTYINLLKIIIKSQEEVIGPLAWTEVGQIKNIVIKDRKNIELEITENPKETINALLTKFFKVFGPTALYVAKRSTYRITKNMQMNQVPEKLL